ncbi:MAG: MBL fold metallo-hydrolase [Promethearchaeota archaeon]|jgi:glyoxylase-like metal-dependent hydrolase (beta-lactamase superfamily II)
MHINTEGKFNDNTYLIEAMTMNLPKFTAIYIVEHNGMRLMIDAGDAIKSRKIVKKIKDYGLYPIHKIVLTHSHWDHAQGVAKLQQLMKESDIEILASERSAEILRNPQIVNEYYNFDMEKVENVTPLKEGDKIDVNGLELEIVNLYGHTMDSIGIIDRKNKNIFVGDAIIDKLDYDAFFIPPMPSDFSEDELLKTFNTLRDIKTVLNSIALAHFGVWMEEDFEGILNTMEDLYFKVKNSIIEWHDAHLSIDEIANRYVEKFMPNSKVWNAQLMKVLIEWMIDGLKL